MKRTNAIIAAVIVVIVIIVAAVGAILVMNPGSTSSTTGGTSDTVMPSGPEGTVNGMVIDTAGTNDSNASGLSDLLDEFNVTSGIAKLPDALAKVAVTNNMTSNITLNCANFTAKLENGSSVQALNTENITLGPNLTLFKVLGFKTNGMNITEINYSSGNISFTLVWTKVSLKSLAAPVMKAAPTGELNATDNVTFSSIDAWKISKNGWAPMSVRFDNQTIVIALLSATNNNTSALNLKSTDFWLDLGNGTWVQADDKINNNVPRAIPTNTTVPFLLGFRGVDNATSPPAIVYWPGMGSVGDRIALQVNQTPPKGPHAVLFKVGNTSSMSGLFNLASNATGQNQPILMELLLVGQGASSANIGEIKAWTLHDGQITGTVMPGMGENTTFENAKLVSVMFTVPKGDTLTLLSYQIDGATKYIWLRPFVVAA